MRGGMVARSFDERLRRSPRARTIRDRIGGYSACDPIAQRGIGHRQIERHRFVIALDGFLIAAELKKTARGHDEKPRIRIRCLLDRLECRLYLACPLLGFCKLPAQRQISRQGAYRLAQRLEVILPIAL